MEYLVAHFKIRCAGEELQTARDLLADEAAGAGFESFEETEEGLDGYVQRDLFDQETLNERLANFPLPSAEIEYKTEEMEDKNWNETWEATGFDPIVVDDTVIIYDAKHASDLHPGQSEDHIEIGIDAVQAFGTGTHETTRMMVSTLLNMDLDGKRILDCGCGTGILGIAAAKMGAREVVGYDIDEWSVENTRHNAELNHVENLEVYHGDAHVLNHVNGLFDVVLANINRNTLLQDMETFKSVLSHGGVLILSGFYEQDIRPIVEKAAQLGLKETGRKAEGEWRCLTLA